MFFISGVLPYITFGILVIGFILRIAWWTRAKQFLPWEIFPYPKSFIERQTEMIKEVVSLYSLIRFNRRIWFQSFLLHWGFYLIVIWIILLLIGVRGYNYVGLAGAILTAIGSFSLLITRIASTEMRKASAFVEYFNLVFVLIVSALLISTNFFNVVERDYIFSLIRLSPEEIKSIVIPSWLLAQLFLIYLPWTRLFHFAGKYFTYERIKWHEFH